MLHHYLTLYLWWLAAHCFIWGLSITHTHHTRPSDPSMTHPNLHWLKQTSELLSHRGDKPDGVIVFSCTSKWVWQPVGVSRTSLWPGLACILYWGLGLTHSPTDHQEVLVMVQPYDLKQSMVVSELWYVVEVWHLPTCVYTTPHSIPGVQTTHWYYRVSQKISNILRF